METKNVIPELLDCGLDLDGLRSWEEFYGSTNEDFVESILTMYDLLIGRTSDVTQDLGSPEKVNRDLFNKYQSRLEKTPDDTGENEDNFGDDFRKNNSKNVPLRSEKCRCAEKSSTETVTRCAAYDVKQHEIRSTDIRDCNFLSADVLEDDNGDLSRVSQGGSERCALVTCPAGVVGAPATPLCRRRLLGALADPSPLALKRSGGGHRSAGRPSSASSTASSSSSSSSGTGGCFEARRLALSHKSSAYLASIESLEGVSDDGEGPLQSPESCRSNKESEEGSEDSGVHSHYNSLPQDKTKYCDPRLTYMDKVVMEIVETEEVYVGDLRKIIQGYLFTWRALPEFPLADRLDSLFGNIETIFHFNSLFLKELKQCELDPVKVARCFVRNNSGFSVYTEYCTNYPRTVSMLTELMRQEGTVRLFRERQSALQQTLPLGSYLLKPVQRILKYHLLLENIVKQYSKGVDGSNDIVDALRTMTEIAQHINDMKRRHEHEVRVQEIQSLLLGWEGEDLTRFGELCAEGTFRVYGAKAARHVFLFDKMLLVTKKKEGGILDYKTHIKCSNLMLIESVPGEPLSFHVIPFDNPKLQYTLQARNLEQKREWTLQLKRVILENYNVVIPSHARQLVMELGQSRSDDDFVPNKSLPKRQHLAPEYLEKRMQDRRKTEYGLKSRLRRNRRFESGKKLGDQFNKPMTRSQNTNEVQRNQTVKSVRRKSESDACSCGKVKPIQDGCFKSEENSPAKERRNGQTLEKFEIKTLEQIVAQILKENVEFDKLLKRQRRRLRGHDLSCASNEKLEALDDNIGSDPTVMENLVPMTRRENKIENGDDLDSNAGGKRSISDDEIPTSPSVWLRQQVEHLPTPSKKAGSLPRSFQITSDFSLNDPRSFRDFRLSMERPFTIASDKLPSSLELDGVNRYCEGLHPYHSNSDITEDGSLAESLRTPGTSWDHINIHPEHKIYRSSLPSNILRNVLSTVHSKLSNIKLDVVSKTESEKKETGKEKKASRMVYAITKQYSKALRNKHKGKNGSKATVEEGRRQTEATLPVHKQGSSSLGARLANFAEGECRVGRVRPAKKAAALLGVRADSVLSLPSTPTAAPKFVCAVDSRESEEENVQDSDESSNSFYERTFEAMDKLLEDRNDSTKNVCVKPPPVPSKPNKELVVEKIIDLSRRRGEAPLPFFDAIKKEEEDKSSQQSTTSTVVEAGQKDWTEALEIDPEARSGAHPRGWVRNIVGKIQGGF